MIDIKGKKREEYDLSLEDIEQKDIDIELKQRNVEVQTVETNDKLQLLFKRHIAEIDCRLFPNYKKEYEEKLKGKFG